MSFSKTTDQIRSRIKTVTRRNGWRHLQPGQILCACVKCQGLERGETVERLAVLLVTRVTRGPLGLITAGDVDREGFPGQTPEQFIDMFRREIGGDAETEITRVEFRFVPGFVPNPRQLDQGTQADDDQKPKNPKNQKNQKSETDSRRIGNGT